MSDETPKSRRVTPRTWAFAGTVAASAMAIAPALTISGFAGLASPAMASSGEAGEAGEGGEGGVTLSEGAAGFLTALGYFEGTYRIIATLYLGGDRDLAREHLETSHHAFYDDIEEGLAGYDAPGFRDEDRAFVAAITSDAPDDEVTAALETLIAALDRTGAAAKAPARDQMLSIRDLLALAAAEYEGGVEDGIVTLGMEYRDSWGFYETARMRAAALAEASDPKLAQAGAQALERMAGLDALYPSLSAARASTDPSPLAGAAAWAEIIALRLR